MPRPSPLGVPIQEFADAHGLSYVTVSSHLRRGRCAWPRQYTKDQTKEPLYHCWVSMKARCLNPKNTAYKNYGGRGIQIYTPWIVNYFLYKEYVNNTLGPKPSDTASLDRIDNNGNYEPGNLRWASKSEQCENRRVFKSNTTGVRGLSRLGRGWWRVKLTINKIRYLKVFKREEDARAYLDEITRQDSSVKSDCSSDNLGSAA